MYTFFAWRFFRRSPGLRVGYLCNRAEMGLSAANMWRNECHRSRGKKGARQATERKHSRPAESKSTAKSNYAAIWRGTTEDKTNSDET